MTGLFGAMLETLAEIAAVIPAKSNRCARISR